eukprot:scaffold8240_cov88-Isochrysis_galbana.AAC.2
MATRTLALLAYPPAKFGASSSTSRVNRSSALRRRSKSRVCDSGSAPCAASSRPALKIFIAALSSSRELSSDAVAAHAGLKPRWPPTPEPSAPAATAQQPRTTAAREVCSSGGSAAPTATRNVGPIIASGARDQMGGATLLVPFPPRARRASAPPDGGGAASAPGRSAAHGRVQRGQGRADGGRADGHLSDAQVRVCAHSQAPPSRG